MQAIFTKFIPCTNHCESRVKAWCDAGSITVGANHADSIEDRHRFAVRMLCDKLNSDNAKRWGDHTPVWRIDWMVCGGAPQNTPYAYVYVTRDR